MSAITVRDDGSLDVSSSAWSALKNSIFPGAKDESIEMAVHYCIARKLDVFKKPCHIVPINTKDAKTGKYEWRDVIMPGIYELRTTAFRTGEMAGIDEPIFGEEKKIHGINAPEWCKITVYRIIAGQRYAFTHTEFFEEAAATKNNGELNSMWTKRPRGQLAKCTEAGALRKAFPDEMGGLMTSDEVSEIDAPQEVDITPNPDLTEKINEIKQLVRDTGSNESRFLSFLGISDYDEITPDIADQAIGALEKKAGKTQSTETKEVLEPEVIDI